MPYPSYIKTNKELQEYNKLPIEERQRLWKEDAIDFYNNLKPFDGNVNKIPDIPAVGEWFTKEIYDEVVIPNLIRCGAISKKDLKIGQWYIGDTRNADKAMWNGKQFVYERCKWNSWFIDEVNHFEDENGYAFFVPIKEIDKPEDLHCEF
ncbi:MAG: hypothetical protein J1F35_05620 [Erysipelotrichales bacterium]|nr:hypothetical protein [Erysipelotrichales bacterium]